MTWREILNELKGMPDEVLDTQAMVFQDREWPEHLPIRPVSSLSPCFEDEPFDGENALVINMKWWDED